MPPRGFLVNRGEVMTVSERKGILRFVDVLADVVGGIALAFMVFCVLLQVFVRYFVNLLRVVSFAWTEEMARFLLIFVTFWGAAIAVRSREHITIPILIDRVSPRVRPFLRLAFITIMGFFLIVVIFGSATMIRMTWRTPVGSGISWLSVGKVYIFLPLGCGLMMLYLVLWTVEIIRELKTQNTLSECGRKSEEG